MKACGAPRAQIARAFPAYHPPAGLSYVVIPPRVRAAAAARSLRDVQAAETLHEYAEVGRATGLPADVVRRRIQAYEAMEAAKKQRQP